MKKVLQSLASVMMLLLVATTVTAQGKFTPAGERASISKEVFAEKFSSINQINLPEGNILKSTMRDDHKLGGSIFRLGADTYFGEIWSFNRDGSEPYSQIVGKTDNKYRYSFSAGTLAKDRYYAVNFEDRNDGNLYYVCTVFDAKTWEEISVYRDINYAEDMPFLLATDPKSNGTEAYGVCINADGVYGLVKYALADDSFEPVTAMADAIISKKISSIAFNPNDGILYGVCADDAAIYEIDLVNGTLYDTNGSLAGAFEQWFGPGYLPVAIEDFPQSAVFVEETIYISGLIRGAQGIGSVFLAIDFPEDKVILSHPLGTSDNRSFVSTGMFDYSALPTSSINDEQANVVANVRGGENTISVDADNVEVSVYNANGQLVASKTVNGSADFSVQAGLYIVKANNQATKVLVK